MATINENSQMDDFLKTVTKMEELTTIFEATLDTAQKLIVISEQLMDFLTAHTGAIQQAISNGNASSETNTMVSEASC